eukprot:CAMPEP_0114978690 /NCGR_PEP_ID=MMETSP0216-20121206/3952_1 /TAXON_ID=223996 /ORGANISM="Protocruzia adherens, Strain Boccale" /LENGTH=509 /DNA_ID=CAMNT_0002339925 /DNA_START=247 /DNA_END=1776 /DNA_ORIENTATION=+
MEFLNKLVERGHQNTLSTSLWWDNAFLNIFSPKLEKIVLRQESLDFSSCSSRFEESNLNENCIPIPRDQASANSIAFTKFQRANPNISGNQPKPPVVFRNPCCTKGILPPKVVKSINPDIESAEHKQLLAFVLWDTADFYGRGWMFQEQWDHFLACVEKKETDWLVKRIRGWYSQRVSYFEKLRKYDQDPWTQPWKGCFNIAASRQYQNSSIPMLHFTISKINTDFHTLELDTEFAYSPFTGLWRCESEGRRIKVEQEDPSLVVFGRRNEGEHPTLHKPDIKADREDRIIGVNQCAIRYFNGRYQVYDLGSMNGTYLRLRPGIRAVLRKDDMFLVGDRNLFKIFTSTLCKGRKDHGDMTIAEFNKNHPLPETEEVDSNAYGFDSHQIPPELSTHIHGGEFVRASMKNFNTVHGNRRRHQDVITLGRRGCTFNFRDRLMSTSHCQISWYQKVGFVLEDHDSKNGTWWSLSVFPDFCIDAPSHTLDLQSGDVLKVGRNQFTINLVSHEVAG